MWKMFQDFSRKNFLVLFRFSFALLCPDRPRSIDFPSENKTYYGKYDGLHAAENVGQFQPLINITLMSTAGLQILNFPLFFCRYGLYNPLPRSSFPPACKSSTFCCTSTRAGFITTSTNNKD